MSEPVTPPSKSVVLPNLSLSPSSTSLHYYCHIGSDISNELLKECATLFGDSYGIWGQNPISTEGPKPGTRVKMSGARLRKQCVVVPERTVLVTCHLVPNAAQHRNHAKLVGHAFATVWDYDGGTVGWVTQLVVSRYQRKRYIATSLLQCFKESFTTEGITAIGLVSSHPAACDVLAKYAHTPIHSVDTAFCKLHAQTILKTSTVDYVKNMELRGSLFKDNCTTGAVSSVFTSFYVDHTEPLEALEKYKAEDGWVLGELLDGHEFLIILPTGAN